MSRPKRLTEAVVCWHTGQTPGAARRRQKEAHHVTHCLDRPPPAWQNCLMNPTTSHSTCDHESTKAARTQCRKDRAAVDTLALDLLKVMTSDFHSNPDHWTFYAASRFAQVHTDDRMIAARAVLDYFLPSGDEDRDAHRRRNGYTVTTDLRTMRSITLNAAS